MKTDKKPVFTIFTPTYNRAHTLARAFESLKNQTLKNFEWLIIDDGSTDDTETVVNSFYNDAKFPIRYVKQDNAGKQAAWNKGAELASGKYFCCLDSDDALYADNNVEDIFQNYIALLDDDTIAGLRFLAFSSVTNSFHGRKLSDKVVVCSWFDEIKSSQNFGERIDVFKTELLRKFPYPVNSKTKFIPEIWFYVMISAENYKFAYIPVPVRIFYDEVAANRLGGSSISKHGEGHYLSRAIILKKIPYDVYVSNPLLLVKSAVRFGQCANLLHTPFEKRKADTNLVYAMLSYLFRFK